MISVNLHTPHEILQRIAEQARAARLRLNLSQQTLSDKSGVSYGSLKKFEQTGQISLESLLKLSLVLGHLDNFSVLFTEAAHTQITSLDELLEDKKRKRGRK